MKTIAYLLIAVLTMSPALSVHARARKVPLDQKCQRSEVIALVRIESVQPLTNKGCRYRSIAKARVISALKGIVEDQTFQLEFDNGMLCPNVLYKTGEECLVFVKKIASGNFETFNYYYGKSVVVDGVVQYWWESQSDVKWEAVAAQIKKHLTP